MRLLLLLSLLFPLSIAQSLSCADGVSLGPDLFGCQAGSSSVNGECCPTASIVVATDATAGTATAQTATTVTVIGGISTQVPVTVSTTCIDQVNPQTGTSDCPTRAYLCNDPNYANFMGQQCPRTCGKCSSGVTSSYGTCRDLANPTTGVSDCSRHRALCSDSQYASVMRTQCPLTCGFCSSTSSSYTLGSSTAATGCTDRANPSTGISDCSRNRQYCTDSLYATLMRQQCPRTCGFCSG